VAGDRGHLSNHQAAAFLNVLADLRAAGTGAQTLRQVYLIHVSENNNTVDRVAEVLRDECRWPGPIRICARNELVVGDQEPVDR
jgi:phosphoribosyl 1,2-cyclic phosphodiesterase